MAGSFSVYRMSDAKTVEFHLWVEDEAASDEELQAMTRVIATELEEHSARVVPFSAGQVPVMAGIPKGEPGGSILDVEINLENIAAFGKWLYGRLVGTSTKAKFEYGGAKFEFDGRNAKELAAVMDEFKGFVTAIESAKQAQ